MISLDSQFDLCLPVLGTGQPHMHDVVVHCQLHNEAWNASSSARAHIRVENLVPVSYIGKCPIPNDVEVRAPVIGYSCP